jgi:CsoR family transcriptional regulator, copper-sensing transcriptional repressor
MKNKNKLLTNLKKTHSLLAKIIKMVEEEKYCIDITQQTLAASGLLKSAQQLLMQDHLNHCFKDAMSSTNEDRKQEMIDEILHVVDISKR